MSSVSRQPARAFSIVELLVVLGIIALLTAILLPSVSRARDQASRTRCLNNIRQIGMGLAVYVGDYDALPPMDLPGQKSAPDPVYHAKGHTGLMVFQSARGFDTTYLSCPDGWASGGDAAWYENRGINRTGAAYMDYAYWPGRFLPADRYDVRAASFTYRAREKGTRILVTDIVMDQSETAAKATVGAGNHGSNHFGREVVVQQTDGRGKRLSAYNRIRSSGGSVLFSDYHASWFNVDRLTQQAQSLCFPPPDQW